MSTITDPKKKTPPPDNPFYRELEAELAKLRGIN